MRPAVESAAPAFSIVIPAYNEGDCLEETLERVLDYVRRSGRSAEVIVVDDGSTDDSAARVRSCAARCDGLRLIQNVTNRGKGYSVRRGLLSAEGDVALFTDADLAAPIDAADKLLDALEAGADVAIGVRRTSAGQSLLRRIAGVVFNRLVRIVLRLPFPDTQCGFKAFTRRAVDVVFPRQRICRWGFDPEVLFIAKLHGLKVALVPVDWRYSGGSRVRVWRDSLGMLCEVLRVRWNGWCGRYGRPRRGPRRSA